MGPVCELAEAKKKNKKMKKGKVPPFFLLEKRAESGIEGDG